MVLVHCPLLRTLPCVLTLAATLLGTSLPAAPSSPTDSSPTAKERAQGYRDFVILAKPHARHRATVDAAERADLIPTHVREKFARFGDLRVITLDSADAADRAIARLRATGRYEFVERDHFFHPTATPNDPAFAPTQWSLNNTGQNGGTVGVDIKAVAAWDVIREAPGVVVAILDSGLIPTHPDLIDNLWRNPAPTFGDINGASFANGIRSGAMDDTIGHGTHVAGIIGATGNNSRIMTGVAWRVQLMPVRTDNVYYIASSDVVAAVDYAIAHGAHIINASFTTDTHSQADYAVFSAARDAGIIVVAAAGNDGKNVDAHPRYFPGNYPLDNIVTVGSSNRNDALSSFSNYGAAVDLIAPGESIFSLSNTNPAAAVSRSGTSMAAPHVTGALALLKARFPTDTYRQLINRLLRGVDLLPAYAGKAQSGGRLNLLKAVTSTDHRPFNDDFAARPRLSGPTLALRSNNTGATVEPGEPALAGVAPTATLWWEWTAPATGPVTLDTVGSGYDTVLAVYSGTSPASFSALTPVASNDNNDVNLTSRLTFAAQAGTTYQFAVAAKNPAATGLTILNLGSAPAHDTFAAAAPLAGASTSLTASTIAAGREVAEPRILGFAGGASVWYRWTAPRTGRFQIGAHSRSFDPLLAVYTGPASATVASLTLLDASDNTAADNSNVGALCTLHAVAGTTYFITVDSKLAANTGEFTLNVTDSLWQAPTLRDLNGAPAVAPDGTVYVGSTDFSLHAIAPDGTTRWSFATGAEFDRSTPAVAADGTVYAYSLDAKLYALRPDGTLRWSTPAGSPPSATAFPFCSSPALAADGTIYLKTRDGFLSAFNPADGSTRWRFNTGAPLTTAAPVIAADGTIYQGSSNRILYALNPDGSLKWQFTAAAALLSSPALDAAGNLYFTVSGRLHSLTPAGTERWAYTGATGAITSSPSLSADGTTVYFGGTDSRLHAVNTADGTARWTFPLGGPVNFSSPALDANGVIYLGCADFKLYAVHATGTLKRTYDTAGPIESSPAIAGTTLYVGSNDGSLYAFDLGAPAAGGPWPQYRQNPARLGRALSAAPRIATAPRMESALLGAAFTLAVSAGGPGPLSYQWRKNGLPIPGATSATFTVANATSADAGTYTVAVTNPFGTDTQPSAIVTVSAPIPGRLANLSVRTNAGTEAQTLIVGFALAGSPDQPLLIRAIGPSLAQFGLTGVLDDPRLSLFSGTTVLTTNDNWGTPVAGTTAATIANAFAATGAFPLDPTSRDAALVRAMGPGSYTVQISSSSASTSTPELPAGAAPAPGLALAEIYATPLTTGARLTNVSARAQVGTGGGILIVGFSISGNVPRTLLLRAVGPTLAAFGVAGALADPQLALYRGATLLQSNDNWGVSGPGSPGPATLASTFAQVSAFALASPASKDAALLVTIPPGSYTAQVSGVAATTGVALVEVYEVP